MKGKGLAIAGAVGLAAWAWSRQSQVAPKSAGGVPDVEFPPVPAPPAPAPGKSNFYGRVIDSKTQEPISQVNVLLSDIYNGDVLFSGLTDNEGIYRVSDIAAGSYGVEVSKEGYMPITTEMTLLGGNEGLGDIYMAAIKAPVAKPHAFIKGTVMETGIAKTIDDVKVHISIPWPTGYAGGFDPKEETVYTDAAGHYRYGRLNRYMAGETVSITFTHPDYAQSMITVKLKEGVNEIPTVRLNRLAVMSFAGQLAGTGENVQYSVLGMPEGIPYAFAIVHYNPNSDEVDPHIYRFTSTGGRKSGLVPASVRYWEYVDLWANPDPSKYFSPNWQEDITRLATQDGWVFLATTNYQQLG